MDSCPQNHFYLHRQTLYLPLSEKKDQEKVKGGWGIGCMTEMLCRASSKKDDSKPGLLQLYMRQYRRSKKSAELKLSITCFTLNYLACHCTIYYIYHIKCVLQYLYNYVLCIPLVYWGIWFSDISFVCSAGGTTVGGGGVGQSGQGLSRAEREGTRRERDKEKELQK